MQQTKETRFLGFPVSEFGFFSSLLLALCSGFITFFATAFFAIIGLLIYNLGGHHTADYAIAYTRIALPVGCVFLVLGFVVFGVLWLRSKVRQK